jgi:hypothetical protein
MIAITAHAHDLLTFYVDNYAAQGCANTAIATLGSGYTLGHNTDLGYCTRSKGGDRRRYASPRAELN